MEELGWLPHPWSLPLAWSLPAGCDGSISLQKFLYPISGRGSGTQRWLCQGHLRSLECNEGPGVPQVLGPPPGFLRDGKGVVFK